MDQFVGRDEIESFRIELSELGRSFRSSLHRHGCSLTRSNSAVSSVNLDEEEAFQLAAIDRLPTFERLRSSLFDDNEDEAKGKRVVDVTKLRAPERHMFIEKLIKHIEHDNLRLLHKMRKRIDKVGVKLPTVEVRYSNLRAEAECEVVYGKPLPTLWNSLKSLLSNITRLPGIPSQEAHIDIINDVSGIIKPGRMTLLLGPPGCGKTTLLKALSGNLEKSLKVTGEISYNGYKLDEFVPQKTSAYISQYDLHIPEMTVRETLDFSSRCQGIGSRAEIMAEVTRREKEAKIVPDPDIDTYMKATSVEGQKTTVQTDYILKILGLDICADTLFGDAMRRGISGGQRKRLTTGEMIVGPTKALFMDEISNGLDSSTTYQIICCLQQLAHITDATILVSLLQPAPETFDLFDDIILMGEGKIVYHGPRSDVLEFFQTCGFRCPERKGVADFLQEVISRKDQEQYWHETQRFYRYVSIDTFSRNYKESSHGKKLSEELSHPFDKSKSHKNGVCFSVYSLPKWDLFKACMSREFLLMKRNSFVYVFKSIQLLIIAIVTMTVFLRTQMSVDLVHANSYLGALFYSLIILIVDGLPELSMTVARLPIFYKQRDLSLYPAWAYAIPAAIVKIPLSLLESIVWTCLTYYVIGYSPEPGRFFRHLMVIFAVHMASISMFRFLASVFQNVVASTVVGSLAIVFLMLFSGFIIPRPSMPVWLKWAFWVSPISYGEIALSTNEFLAPRWQMDLSRNTTVGHQTLQNRGLNFGKDLFWISVGALLGFTLLFNIGFTLALSFLKSSSSRAIISSEQLSKLQGAKELDNDANIEERSKASPSRERMVLPFQPLSITFQDIQYYVETPMAIKEHGFTEKRLQLLWDITGAFRPGILTALMGVSGAGKTTLLDVLAGRKTSGMIEGEIKIGGYSKVQSTFARISGYCEQTDIHSPQITVEESVIFSAWLRLSPEIDSKTKYEFVKEVLETIELDNIKDALVGSPGVDGLSTEQRKRLTIAVELVSNPSIIFMDEPTTGLDARAAAIVMRAVKNVANTGRTIVCTIHQPSIDIFEAFDELLLLKAGGRMIYCGPLGQQSSKVIEYFEGISRVPKIRDNYNPATWMLEVTSTFLEAELGIDFAQIYKNSTLHENINELVRKLSTPPSGSKDLHFPTRYSQNGWGQFKSCLWRQHLSYWRNPSYNLMRSMHMLFASCLFGFLFWENQQSLFTLLGSMYSSVLCCGINNSSSVLPYVSKGRTILYRERFAGMYASWAYSAAQVVVEIPYLLAQAIAFTVITYPMIGYYWSAYKVFWYFYTMFCTLLYFTYFGMMLVSITPSFPVAAIAQSAFYTMMNLFAGFLIPHPQIPRWWIWFYYVVPTSWSLNGMLTSQFGDVEEEIVVFGETTTVAAFLRDYFGYRHDLLPLVGIILLLYPIIFASFFAFFIAKLSFQRR
ncbi:Pleiotropic drug resistance proteins (PDR1-15), ABC superfamily [Handroanthus impetiginosus]|uniref:Pleiotropic drug resistance proteins (PDR1-15), ABC superfamily n=1 Tax=Handroanthus impetiginosus TaxID=429701 RepID=A0A2G9GCM5_9LAMI|nr:Pleiotropic drug resistance proteins (PDR1-15), ABC superfamily [Handroanthus impetiginosus]